MLKTFATTALLAAALSVPQLASAQTSAETKWSLGLEGGAQAVENVGGLGGAQLALHITPRLAIVGEAVYLQDVVTRRRIESASNIATYLSQTQGRTASSSLDVPAWAVTAGVRLTLKTSGGIRPYVIAQGGIARVTLRPAFSLAGADVTTTLSQYGVVLGSDLTGSSAKPVFGGGIGITAGQGPWFFDAAVRILSIQLDGQTANTSTIAFGIGRRF